MQSVYQPFMPNYLQFITIKSKLQAVRDIKMESDSSGSSFDVIIRKYGSK